MADSAVFASSFAYAAVAAMGTALLVKAARRPGTAPHGWRMLKPSAMHWTGLVLSVGLVGLMGYVYFFVGSSRPDGAQQMRILLGLLVAFGLGFLIIVAAIVAIHRQALCWRGTLIEYGPSGNRRRIGVDSIVAARGDWLGRMRFDFEDGTTLAIDPYAQGAARLIEAVAERLNRL